MLGKTRLVAVKEFRELIREKTVLFGVVLGPLLMFAIFSGMAASMGGQVEEARSVISSIVVVAPSGLPQELDSLAKAIAASIGADLYYDSPPRGDIPVVYLSREALVNLSLGLPAVAEAVVPVNGLSFFTLSIVDGVDQMVDNAILAVAAEALRGEYPHASIAWLRNPVSLDAVFLYKGMEISRAEAMALLFGVNLILALATMVLVVSVMQVSATSMAMEKEAKTLEMTLSLPLTEREIILGKSLGITGIAFLGIVSYGIGLALYARTLSNLSQAGQGGIEAGVAGQQAGLALNMTPSSMILIMLGLVATLIVSMIIGLIVGSIAEDVRGAQLAGSYIGLVLMAPLFGAFLGIDVTGIGQPWRTLALLDPMVPLYYFAWGSIIGDTELAAVGAAGIVAHALAWLLLAGRLLRGETVITGLRLRIPGVRG